MGTTKAPQTVIQKFSERRGGGEYHVKLKNDDLKEFKKFDEKTLVVGSKFHELYLEAKTYLKYSLDHEILLRDDYNHLVIYVFFYLDVSSP